MRRFLILALALASAGCGSLNVPFIHLKPNYSVLPADAMKEVARDIEQAVQAGKRDADIPDRGGIVVNDEYVKQAVRTRAARAELVNQFLSAGYGREDRNGLIRVLRTKDYKKAASGRQRDRDALLIMSENSDRWAIYEGLIRTSRIVRRSLPAVQEIFHEARVACMKDGQPYEDASGKTVMK